jgi:two-component system cell cycle sensor histidine kinase/response regulator CckA
LLNSERKYRTHFENVSEVIYSIGRNFEVLDVSPSVERMLGYKPEELIGKPFHDLNILVPDSLEKAYNDLMRIFSGETINSSRYEYFKKDGSKKIGELSGTPVYHDGELVMMVSVARDITEKKYYEDQIQHSKKMEAIGTLAGGIAHDFNNLLMGILGHTSLLSVNLDHDHPNLEHTNAIEEYVRSAVSLTNQLLGLVRGGKYEVKPIDINALLSSTAKMFGRTRKQIRIRTKTASGPLVINADKRQIDQVLLNIFVNAWQAMPDGGEMYLETSLVDLDKEASKPYHLEPGQYVKVSIVDTGTGMPEEILQKIFDPFFTTKEKGRGTGLGLASAYGIISNHGGVIRASSKVGHGSTFTIYLPTTNEKLLPEAQPVGELVGGTETILLVDDEAMIVEVGKSMLERLGYRVVIANCGKEAIESVTEMGQ